MCLHTLLVPLELCKAAEANWTFGPGLTPALNQRIIVIEQEYSFFRSVTEHTNDSRWVTKRPTNDNPLHMVEWTGEYTVPSDCRISNNKSTIWKLILIVEGQLPTLSLLHLWHYLKLT